MGNSVSASSLERVRKFYRPTSWIEGAAEKQLSDLSVLPGVLSVAAQPDLHPGKFGPVGVCVDIKDLVYPAIIGTDIGCGVSLASTGIEARKLRVDRTADRLIEVFNTSESGSSFSGLGIGSIGGGNHFCELSVVRNIIDEAIAAKNGIHRGEVQVLVHTGSRAMGASIFDWYQATFGNGPLQEGALEDYLGRHDLAVDFARRNRRLIAERAVDAIRGSMREVSDVRHNFIEKVGDAYRHRKGASTTLEGLCVVLGSRGAMSYVVAANPGASEACLSSIAHGAGRKMDRASARSRFGGKGVLERTHRGAFGGRVICLDKNLAAEESPGAYKPIEQVVDDLVAAGLVRVVASLQPLVTYKTAGVTR